MKKVLIAGLIAVSGIASAQIDCEQVIDAAKTGITKNFKDPSSAQFRRIKVIEVIEKEKPTYIAVGEVNAKNSYGGYVGFAPFGTNLFVWTTPPMAFAGVVGSGRDAVVFENLFGPRIINVGKVVCQ